MGIFNSLRSLGYKAYNSIKNMGPSIYGAVHKISGAANYVDELLNEASDIPIFGEIADNIRNNRIYQTVLDGVTTLDEFTQLAEDRGAGGFLTDVGDFARGIALSPLA